MITPTYLSYNEFIGHLAFVQYLKKLKNALHGREGFILLCSTSNSKYIYSVVLHLFFCCSQSYISRTLYLCVAVPQSLNLSKEKQYVNLTNIHFISLCTYTLLKHTNRMFMHPWLPIHAILNGWFFGQHQLFLQDIQTQVTTAYLNITTAYLAIAYLNDNFLPENNIFLPE